MCQLQGGVLVRMVLYRICRGLEGIDARIVHTQHDEIIVEARDGIQDQVRVIVKGAMEAALVRIIPEVQLVVEIRVAEAWGLDLPQSCRKANALRFQ